MDDDWIDPLLLMAAPEQRRSAGRVIRRWHYLAALGVYLVLVAINIFVLHAFG